MSTTTEPPSFVILGAAAAIAPRHLRALARCGGKVVGACDPHDSVAALDEHALDVAYFVDPGDLQRHLEERRAAGSALSYVVVCSPNHLHDEHCRLGLQLGADVICEKPVVIDPRRLDALAAMEWETGRRVWTVLQLRYDQQLLALRARLAADPLAVHDVELSYVTARGRWYDASWKGDERSSGGIATNIGVHMFDLLGWLFGAVRDSRVHLRTPHRASGHLEFDRARVRWFLSISSRDLPPATTGAGGRIHRVIRVDGEDIAFSASKGDLHARVYEELLVGRGLGLDVARPSIELAHRIRTSQIVTNGPTHSWLSSSVP